MSYFLLLIVLLKDKEMLSGLNTAAGDKTAYISGIGYI